MKRLKPEAGVLKAITDLLSAERILHWRMNAGDRLGTHNGKTWRIKGHDAGTADILAAPVLRYARTPVFLWIEAKRPNGGRQSPEQVEFQRKVEAQGHYYIIARSSDEVLAKLAELRCDSTEDHPIPMMSIPLDKDLPF